MVIKIKKVIEEYVTLTRLAKCMLSNADSRAGNNRQISKRTLVLLLLFL